MPADHEQERGHAPLDHARPVVLQHRRRRTASDRERAGVGPRRQGTPPGPGRPQPSRQGGTSARRRRAQLRDRARERGCVDQLRPGSPATFLNGTLLKQGELIEDYYATGHGSLDNYIAQISGQAPTEETSADCLGPGTNLSTLIGSYDDLPPGNLDRNQQLYPGQVDGHGCIYPAFVQTIANQLDRIYPPNPFTHMAAWRDYDEDMGTQPTGRELGAPDPLGGLDCGHPPLNGPDNTNAASPATATEPAD